MFLSRPLKVPLSDLPKTLSLPMAIALSAPYKCLKFGARDGNSFSASEKSELSECLHIV